MDLAWHDLGHALHLPRQFDQRVKVKSDKACASEVVDWRWTTYRSARLHARGVGRGLLSSKSLVMRMGGEGGDGTS